MQCTELTTAPVCYTDAAGVPQTLVAHYEYGVNATGATILVATRYTDAAGTPVDTSAGAVVAGACPVAQPDVEFEKLCHVDDDGNLIQEFMCRTVTSFDAAGAVVDPVQVDNFELDKVTPYDPTTTGSVTACTEDCEPATAQGLLTAWG